MAQGIPTDGWKLTVEHWVEASKVLLDSMRTHGFMPAHAIPLDKHGELLNGTHRLACAMAIGLQKVYTIRLLDKEVWAPAWGGDWFHENGMPREEIEKLARDFEALCGRQNIETGD